VTKNTHNHEKSLQCYMHVIHACTLTVDLVRSLGVVIVYSVVGK